MDPIKVGNYLASLRKEKNLTQEELAERINVSSKTISKWEVGTNIPDTTCLYKLSKEFNVPTQDILNGGEVHNESENNDSIKNGINFYNKLFKRKVIKIVVLIIIAIVSLFSILYTISNYNRVQVYDILTNDENFTVRGYIITNSKESIFIIDSIRYNGNDGGMDYESKVSFYNIYVNVLNNNIYNHSEELYYSKNLNEMLKDIKISFITNDVNDILNKAVLNIHIFDENGQKIEYKIKLNMKKHYSNNKIMYQ